MWARGGFSTKRWVGRARYPSRAVSRGLSQTRRVGDNPPYLSDQANLFSWPAGKSRWIQPMILTIVAGLMVLHLAGELILGALNRAEVRRHATMPPPAVAAIMDEATYAKSVAYTLEKS